MILRKVNFYLIIVVFLYLSNVDARVRRVKKKNTLPELDGVQAQEPIDYEEYDDNDYVYYDLEEKSSK